MQKEDHIPGPPDKGYDSCGNENPNGTQPEKLRS